MNNSTITYEAANSQLKADIEGLVSFIDQNALARYAHIEQLPKIFRTISNVINSNRQFAFQHEVLQKKEDIICNYLTMIDRMDQRRADIVHMELYLVDQRIKRDIAINEMHAHRDILLAHIIANERVQIASLYNDAEIAKYGIDKRHKAEIERIRTDERVAKKAINLRDRTIAEWQSIQKALSNKLLTKGYLSDSEQELLESVVETISATIDSGPYLGFFIGHIGV
jgi:hypothetical protein